MAGREFEVVTGLDRGAQLEWMRSLRPRTAFIELVFCDGDDSHPLVGRLSVLKPSRRKGVGVRPGYSRSQPDAVLLRYRYDREIVRALEDLGGFFSYVATPTGDQIHETDLGNVDVAFLDAGGDLLGATVTHEGLVLVLREPQA